jgi:hypothetical protein
MVVPLTHGHILHTRVTQSHSALRCIYYAYICDMSDLTRNFTTESPDNDKNQQITKMPSDHRTGILLWICLFS